MTVKPERWQKIDKILEVALEQKVADRSAFLEEACAGDEALREEVESLLAADEQAEDLMEEPALEMEAKGMAEHRVSSLVGLQIGSYKILSLLGVGGMGEVYCAEDLRLGRKVALKFLTQALQQNSAAKKRLLREAKSAAALDHPYICKIYEIGEAEGKSFITMEYIQGETLKDKLAKGPLPLKDALEKAAEIAEALEEAHKQGIVHRDLKPSNVMLTPQGHAKVMDFGLAKRLVPTEGVDSQEEASLTKTGMTFGTLTYMSPEQLRGEDVDTRSDIFPFGIVLYEMLTGVHLFKKDTPMETANAILNEASAPLSLHMDEVPPVLQHTVKKMLAKEPDRRYQLIHDVGTDLGELIERRRDSQEVRGEVQDALAPATVTMSVPERKGRERLAWSLVAVLALVAAVALLVGSFRSVDRGEIPIKVSVAPPENTILGNSSTPVISPDGRRLAIVARRASGRSMIWVRALDSLKAQPLSGTEGARSYLFWSPDSQFLVFFADQHLKKVEVSSGAVQTLADAPSGEGGTWNREGVILFAPSTTDGLYRVSAGGGVVTPVTALDPSRNETGFRWPHFHPDGRHFVYFNLNQGIYVSSLDSKETKQLMVINSIAAFAASDHLLFVQNETLMAQPFDIESLELTGEAVPVAEEVAWLPPYGNAAFSLSENGVLAYRSGGSQKQQLTWVNRDGIKLGTLGEPGYYQNLELSRDDKRLAVGRIDSQTGKSDIWLVELSRGIASRLTSDPSDERFPIWSPDGHQILFSSDRRGKPDLYVRTLDSGEEELIVDSPGRNFPRHWTRDGQFILFGWFIRDSLDLWMLPLMGEGKPKPILETPFSQWSARVSPDGRWLAYNSNESGRVEAYIQPFQTPGEKLRLSVNGSGPVSWRGDGKELFYLALDGTMMAVPIQAGDAMEPGIPQSLFQTGIATATVLRQFAVTEDGQRFLLLAPLPAESATAITVVLNWNVRLEQ